MRRLPSVRFLVWTVAALAGASASRGEVPAADDSAAADRVRFFETSVRPLLVERCVRCHGAETQWAGLRLDSGEAVLRGGESGPAVVPGSPGESLLLRAVRHADDASPMPPEGEGERLTDRQVADLARWVAEGVVYPAGAAPSARSRDRNHWAFRPPSGPPVPEVRDSAWPRNAIDRFVLARLEAEGLSPAPEADRRTLLRRLTFDLTGLPPTAAEVEAFVVDRSPDAYERAVDRLLASPAYGERWGRHWLDVARYADSNGLDENVAHGNAWRYRDYVVSAFNGDVPYDRFLVEQVAGDLLPAGTEADRRRNLIATGFLALGPKVLAEVDEAKMEMDIVDEQVDTLGRAVLGLTLGCARCHDHKFDPIDASDYYALAGVLKSTRTMESFTKIARWHENVLPGDETRALTAAHEARLAAAKGAVVAAVEAADAALAAAGSGGGTAADREALYPDAAKAELKRLRDELAAIEKAAPELPSAMGVADGTAADVAIHLRGDHLKLGEVVRRGVPAVFATPSPPAFPSDRSGRLEFARWLADPGHPLTARVFVNRVWRWHFGRGLVRTPDNFGSLGEPPTHPELLDWLAVRFVADGRSVKALHRAIVLSGTYRQGDRPAAGTLERDPENGLFGRAGLRRLEAEAVRDALLAVSGRLDRSMGGSLLTVENRAFFFDHTSKDATTYDAPRRSLYLPVVRNNVYDLFRLFDFPDPAVANGDRATTTVAPQSLLLMNSDLVADAAAATADGLLADPTAGDADRVRRLYAAAYGRDPSADELAADLAFVGEAEASLASAGGTSAGDARRRAWACLCQVAFAASEFVYVR